MGTHHQIAPHAVPASTSASVTATATATASVPGTATAPVSVPVIDNQRPRRASEALVVRPHHSLPKQKSLVDAPPPSSALPPLAMLFQKLAVRRRRRHRTQQHASRQPSHGDASNLDRERDPLARRAQQAIANAWASLHHRICDSVLVPPQFLLRTQRRISQNFNLKVVNAVGKDIRRIESERRSSLTSLDMALPPSSQPSSGSWTEEDESETLSLGDRLSLTVGRRVSRDFAPMLTEGSVLERRVREMVYGLLRDATTLEGHVCATFFAKQEQFTSPRPASCRFYLNRVRDTISDLVHFIVEYRLHETYDDLWWTWTEANNDAHDGHDEEEGAFSQSQAVEQAVRRAVEEYFCFSLRYELRQWCASAAEMENRSQFKKTLAKWRALPSTSREFGLQHHKNQELSTTGLIAQAIAKLQEIETIATPSRKMDNLLAACHLLSDYIAHGHTGSSSASLEASRRRATLEDASDPSLLFPGQPSSPTSRVCVGSADAFLPLLIFVVSRSGLSDAFVECAFLHGLFPFASQHGERMYYLTMLEASLAFIRTHS